MWDFFKATRDEYPDFDAESDKRIVAEISKQVIEMQKVVDAMCKVYVAEHAKEIDERDPDERFFRTDQPMIDRARLLELERQVSVAQMELRELQRKRDRHYV